MRRFILMASILLGASSLITPAEACGLGSYNGKTSVEKLGLIAFLVTSVQIKGVFSAAVNGTNATTDLLDSDYKHEWCECIAIAEKNSSTLQSLSLSYTETFIVPCNNIMRDKPSTDKSRFDLWLKANNVSLTPMDCSSNIQPIHFVYAGIAVSLGLLVTIVFAIYVPACKRRRSTRANEVTSIAYTPSNVEAPANGNGMPSLQTNGVHEHTVI